MAAQAVIFETFAVGPLHCNCTILGDPVTGEALVVDPGGDGDLILRKLGEHHLKVKAILHTHAHFDHFLAADQLHQATGAPTALHQEDRFLWEMVETQCGMFGIPCAGPIPLPQHWLSHEEELSVGSWKGCALHTPGHTPGSMSFSFPEARILVAGDTLFKGGVGRTDLWGGNFQAIERSIQTCLYPLDEATTVVTGHGPLTTIGEEVRHNPYVRALR